MEILLFILIPLGMAVLGISLIANAVESIRKSVNDLKK